MRVLIAVINDLWHFSKTLFSVTGTKEQALRQSTLPAPSVAISLLPPLHPSIILKEDDTGEISVTTDEPLACSAVCTITEVTVHHEPTVAFDNGVAVLPQGARVVVGRRSGRFIHIVAGDITGWIDAETIGAATSAFPQFLRGRFYSVEDSETVKLRTFIRDSFLGGCTGTILQGVEYVTYRIEQAGRRIPWQESWGRIAGTWQRKLRGVRGIHIDVFPRTGSIMEYIIDDVGYVAYIERVTPQLEITISSIGLTHEGQYTEQVLDHTLWRELHPVFITVS